MKHGFTVLELAIVIVIIALLVGGVLVGRSLVAAATIKNYTASLDRYNSGAATFRLKYKALPGDIRPGEAMVYGMVSRTGESGHGDGNGLLEGCAQNSQRLGCETALFWRDMWEGGVSPLGVTLATDIPVDGTVPGFRIEDYLPITPFRPGSYTYAYMLHGRNSFYLSTITSVANDGTLTTSAGITPLEARSIDDKIDDTAPDNGIVRAMSDLSTYDNGATPAAGVCVNNTLSTLAYNVLEAYENNITCQVSIRSSL